MADNTTTSALLNNSGPAAPGGPGPTPADGGTPAPTQQQQGAAELADLKANPDFVRKYLAGDAKAKAKMRAAIEKAHTPSGVIINGDPQALHERSINSLEQFADIGPQVAQQIREGRLVSEHEYRAAVHRRAQLMADGEWAQRYLAGDRAARQEMALVTVILCSRLQLEKRAR